MLKQRMGVFATRTPHRPNPIGITLAKIERVDKAARTVVVSGIDLVDGTPIVDLKPYVPGRSTPSPLTIVSCTSCLSLRLHGAHRRGRRAVDRRDSVDAAVALLTWWRRLERAT